MIGLAFLLLFFSGCVNEEIEGDRHTFTYELWLPALVLVGGIVAGVAGFFLREATGRLGWALLIGGPIAAIFFAPSLFLERAVVDDSMFSNQSGIWGLTAGTEVQLDEIKSIRITSKEVRSRRRRSTNYYLVCTTNDGSDVTIPVNNKVSETAGAYLLRQAAGRGIPVLDQT